MSPGTDHPTIIVRRALAIGDALAATVVADKLIAQGFPVHYQTHPFIHSLIKRHPRIAQVTAPNGSCHVNLDGAYENSQERRTRHMNYFWFREANTQLAHRGINLGEPRNCRPRIVVEPARTRAVKKQLMLHPRPWVFICPRSHEYKVRQIPAPTWQEAAKHIKGTCFWLGLDNAPPGIVDLQCRKLDPVTVYLSAADLLVTVDTGPMHIAAALGVPIVAICQASNPELHLGDQSDFLTIKTKLDCLNCQRTQCPINAEQPPCMKIDPEFIAAWVNSQLRATQSDDISAVIPIYRPKADMLNRCLKAVLPQVNQVIVTREMAGTVPTGAMTDTKIRYVVKNASKIGFGRNVNFGVRQSNGKFVLVLNDDVFLAPDAVQKMMAVMKRKVGVVGQMTRYPDGTIYHAGKVRSADGGIGFPHIDWRKQDATIREPCEMENTNGASLLFRREAFFDVAGYDEDFLFYAEDDDVCMKLRRAGWQVWYTPLANGIHAEHAETRNMPGIRDIMQQSNRLFASKWGEYFRHNKDNRGLGNFGYLKE